MKGPRLLVGCRHQLLSVRPLEDEITVLHESNGSYYGVAYDDEHFYVATRCEGSGGAPYIGVWDWMGHFEGHLRPPFALLDMHQIERHGDYLWIVCAGDDSVVTLHLPTSRWDKWFPYGVHTFDEHHFNSINFTENAVLLMAHNQPPGVQPQRDRGSAIHAFALQGAHEPRGVLHHCGFASHNIWLEGDDRYGYLDSMGGRMGFARRSAHEERRREILLHGFPRGVACVEGRYYIGLSPNVYDRVRRAESTGRILVLDESWKVICEMQLPGDAGNINEIRAPGYADRCTTMHKGVPW